MTAIPTPRLNPAKSVSALNAGIVSAGVQAPLTRTYSTQPASRSYYALAIALFALTLIPVFLVRVPGMLDYPNHLARIAILARDGLAGANPYYHAAWGPLPNIALDVFAAPLARLIGAEAAVKTFLVLAQLLTLSGAVALEVAVKGRPQYAPFVAPAFLFNAAFGLGFLNFEFGVGLALWALAGWIALERAPWAAKLAFTVVVEPLLYFSHLFALGLFGYVAGLLTISKVLRKKTKPVAALGDFVTLAAPFVVLELFLDPGGQSPETAWWFPQKLATLFLFSNGANAWVSRLDALVVVGVLGWLGITRRLAFACDGLAVAIGLVALYIALPGAWRGGALIDMRAPVCAMLVLPAFLRADFRSPGRAAIAASAFAALNIGAVAAAWLALAPDQRAIIDSFGKLGARARVLTAYTSQGALLGPLRHVPTLAAGFGDAFAADLFAYQGQQPLAPAAEFSYAATPGENDQPTLAELSSILHGGVPMRDYLRDWQKHFDFVYVVGPRAENPDPGLLTPLASGREFDLYRIEKTAP